MLTRVTHHLRLIILLATAACLSGNALALSPELKADNGKLPLRLSDLDVDVQVIGNIASTELTMQFFNDTTRILEGELVFPLAEGQNVTDFALDINGHMRKAVSIEKNQARQVFETIVRRGVDPAILEKVAGNSFKLRVYPIMPGSNRTVQVRYDEVLQDSQYCSPLALQDAVDQYALSVEVLQHDQAPTPTGSLLGQAQFEKAQDKFVAAFQRQDFQPDGQLCFALPASQMPYTAAVEADPNGGQYVHVQFPVPQLQVDNSNRKTLKTKQTLAIYWDVSASQAEADNAMLASLFEQYFADLEQRGVTQLTVQITPFAHQPLNQTVTLIRRQGQYTDSSLTAAIKALQFDGGTQLGALDLQAVAADHIYIVSDGISNLGAAEPQLPTDIPVSTISASSHAEHGRLQHIANQGTGQYVNLNRTTLPEALQRLRGMQTTMNGLSASYNGKNVELDNPYPHVGSTVNDQLDFIAYLPDATDTLVFSFKGADGMSEYTQRIALPSPAKPTKPAGQHHGLLQRLWAQRHVAALELEPERNRARIVAVGQQYNLSTRYTSMIVLENLSDYVDNNIEPPEELLTAYNNALRNRTKRVQQTQQARLDAVAYRWAEEIAWWETRHPRTKPGPRWIREQAAAARAANAQAAAGENRSGLLGIAADGMVAANQAGTANDEAIPTEEIQQAQPTTVAAVPPPPPPAAMPVFDTSETSNTSAAEDDMADLSDLSANNKVLLSTQSAQGERREAERDRTASRSPGNTAPATAPEPFGDFQRQANIQLERWNPSTPYLDELEQALNSDDAYHRYLQLRPDYARNSGFFLDAGDYFEQQQRPDLALRIFSNIAEMELENVALMRILAYRLLQLNEIDLAVNLFERVLELRDDEPQSWRDLGLAYAKANRPQAAADTLWEVVRRPWQRFPDIEIVALHEFNQILGQHADHIDTSVYDERLLKRMPLDLRIVLTWDADNTDIDLWVTDPYGEKTYYSNPNSRIGGRISRDFTGGYGPEHYLIRRAVPGDYTIQANYYGTNQQTLSGKTTIQAEIITNWGKDNEARQAITLRLNNQREVVNVGTANIGG